MTSSSPEGTFRALRVEHLVRQVFLETVSVFSADDTVIAERGLRDVSIVYTSAAASASLWDPNLDRAAHPPRHRGGVDRLRSRRGAVSAQTF